MPTSPVADEWPEHELVLLGQLVGDGSYLKHQPLRYTTASEENSAAVARLGSGHGERRSIGTLAWAPGTNS